jgi:hypothetical protein
MVGDLANLCELYDPCERETRVPFTRPNSNPGWGPSDSERTAPEVCPSHYHHDDHDGRGDDVLGVPLDKSTRRFLQRVTCAAETQDEFLTNGRDAYLPLSPRSELNRRL